MRPAVFTLPPCTPYVLLAIMAAPLLWTLLHIVTHLGWETTADRLFAWRRKRREFWDAGQSKGVRMGAEKLATRRTENRIEAVRILVFLNDASAVPALIRAAERYDQDVPFLMEVVTALRHFNDPRALPTLRGLTEGRHYGLMQAARRAADSLEPCYMLLRPSEAPDAASDILLRPAAAPPPADPKTLLRAAP